ncbi:hypothetical protein V6D40_05835 [Corynebacterium sp. Q4381]|uniref:hypothetical protein n=1 Tax=Corynebacterium sp. Marseille-Q4381 TaxID=3121597 RepID=UPI002FE59192
MSRRALAALLAAAALSGCSAGETWQVVEVYTDPTVPGALPERATVRVHGSTFEGATPCAKLEGSFSLDDALLTLTTLTQETPADTCLGAARYTHNQVTAVAKEGAMFEVREASPSEKLLVSTEQLLDPPSIRVLREQP